MPISIGLPFYNAEQFLIDAIRSIFAQTYQDWELILVDDGSTDKSLEIAHSIKDSRVRVISDGKNKKLAFRLNQITSLAKYDFIGRMDADDLISPFRFEKQMAIFQSFPEIDLVSTGVYSITDNLELISARWNEFNTITFNQLLQKKHGVVHASILARKAWYQRNRYDESLKIAQDFELWLRSSFKNDFNIFMIQEPLYYYREESNVTMQKILAAYKNDRRMFLKYGGKDTIELTFKSFCKSIVVTMLSKLNKTDYLLKKRGNNIIESTMRDIFINEINQIRKSKVPGFD